MTISERVGICGSSQRCRCRFTYSARKRLKAKCRSSSHHMDTIIRISTLASHTQKQRKNTCWKGNATSLDRQPLRRDILPLRRQRGRLVRRARQRISKRIIHTPARHQLVHSILVGRTPIGERVWDMSRLIDGAIADLTHRCRTHRDYWQLRWWDGITFSPRHVKRVLTVAVPSCYFCTFEGSIGMIRHCECNYVPGVMRLGEMYDVAGLIAPRPFCAIAGRGDGIFPIDHVEFAYERLKNYLRGCWRCG